MRFLGGVNNERRLSEAALDEGYLITAYVMREAADEIEYLRQRCEELDNEARLQAEVRCRKDGWG